MRNHAAPPRRSYSAFISGVTLTVNRSTTGVRTPGGRPRGLVWDSTQYSLPLAELPVPLIIGVRVEVIIARLRHAARRFGKQLQVRAHHLDRHEFPYPSRSTVRSYKGGHLRRAPRHDPANSLTFRTPATAFFSRHPVIIPSDAITRFESEYLCTKKSNICAPENTLNLIICAPENEYLCTKNSTRHYPRASHARTRPAPIEYLCTNK
jgi:hypothetical protein